MASSPLAASRWGTIHGQQQLRDCRCTPSMFRAFYMDRYEVTKALWDEVYNWAVAHGYSFEYGAQGKATNHPVQTMTWYDAVKWCNARSEKEGRVPAYYTDAGLSVRYTERGRCVPYAEVEWMRVSVADGGGVGEGGAGRGRAGIGFRGRIRTIIAQPGELQQSLFWRKPISLRLEFHGRLSSGVHQRATTLHESGGVVCGQRVWVCMTWRGTCGSGVGTGIRARITSRSQEPIRVVPLQARAACFGAAVGTTPVLLPDGVPQRQLPGRRGAATWVPLRPARRSVSSRTESGARSSRGERGTSEPGLRRAVAAVNAFDVWNAEKKARAAVAILSGAPTFL